MVVVEKADQVPEPNDDGAALLLFVVVLLGGIAVLYATIIGDARRWHERRVTDFLNDIRYGERVDRDDVRYVRGKAYRLVPDGSGSDGFLDKWGRYQETDSWTVFKRIEVQYEDVPPQGDDWAVGAREARLQKLLLWQARHARAKGPRS